MVKRLSLLITAAVALAFAAPVAANAATGLTETAGTLIPTGKIITFTNVGNGFITAPRIGNLTCAPEAMMSEARLEVNTSATVKLGAGGNAFTSICNTAGGGVAKVKNYVWRELDTSGGGTLTATIRFEFELSGGAICVYEGVNISGSYSPGATASGGNVITFSEQPVTLLSGACGTTKVDFSFSLATQGTTTKVFLM